MLAYGRDILRENPNLAKPLEALHELMVARSDVLMEDKKVKPPRSSVPAAKELQVGVMQLKHKRVTTSHNVPTMFVDA